MKILRRFCARVAWLLLVVVMAGCATPGGGARGVNFFSIQQDIELGQAALQANNEAMEAAGVPINQDRVRLIRLEYMVERIGAVSRMPDLPYTVTLYHTNMVNAAAAPGGAIMVFEGLYDPEVGLVQNDDELAAVIAHEIAHITSRHTTRRLSAMQSASILAEIAGALVVGAGHASTADLVRTGFMVAGAVWLPAYSRADEAEADRVGLMYMARAGYDPRAALAIWERAMEKQESMGRGSIFDTHPTYRDRHVQLQRMLPAAMQAYERALEERAAAALSPAKPMARSGSAAAP